MAIELQGGSSAYADSVLGLAESYISRLGLLDYSAPTVSVTWNSLPAPSLPGLPATPVMPDVTFNNALLGQTPEPLTLDLPTTVFSEFTAVEPELNIQPTPLIQRRTAPVIPSVRDVSVPTAPDLGEEVTPPTYLELRTVTFAGVDLHLDWLDRLNDIPTLTLVEPTPFNYTPGPEYESNLLLALKGILEKRLLGGTGLPESVEQAVWDRARDREAKTALANEADIQRSAEALGFALPSGILTAQLREARKNYYEKVSGLSRDIAIKQAELEQENMKQTVASVMTLEGTLIEYTAKREQLAFEAAKVAAENAIALVNQANENYKTLMVGYQAYGAAYDTLIKAELAQVEVLKAESELELSKSQINRELTERYKAEIEARMSRIRVFEGQLGAAKTLMELEGLRLSAAGEEVKAFIAAVNADTAQIEAVKAANQAEEIKERIYQTKAQAFSAVVAAQSERSKAELARYTALRDDKRSEWEGYKVRLEAEGMRLDALGKQSTAMLEVYRAGAQAVESQARMTTMVWETQIKDYEASQNIAYEAAKVNLASFEATRTLASRAAEVAAQTSAQLASSALGQYHFGESNSFGRSISYSYSNDTTTAVSPMT